MNEEFESIRKLIAGNQTGKALEIFVKIAKVNPEFQNQLLTLTSKFNDVRKKENLGLISSSETFMTYSQINFSVLNLLSEYENNVSVTSSVPKKVFISYNHNDSEVANKLKEKLKANSINVTIDSESLQAGDDIKTFIEKSVRDTETTISVVSRNSLLSAWVAMESINTYYHEKTEPNKKFIACYIEDDFLKRSFTDEALNLIDAELDEIETLKKLRSAKGRDTRDLNNEYTRLKELSNNLDEVIRRLRENLCIDIRGEKFEENFKKILQAIESK
ncbi:MAG: TIR domain-containing protein [Ginsengibacter sp.]